MRRVYSSAIICAIILVLALGATGNAPAASLQSHSAALSGAGIPAASSLHVQDGTRKLPPATNPVAVPPDPSYRPAACLETVVNVSQTTGNQSESAIVINPTNTQNVVAFSNV